MKPKHLILSFATVLLVACGQTEEEPQIDADYMGQNREEIATMLQTFYESLSQDQSRTNNESLVIDEIKSDFYHVTSEATAEKVENTRSDNDTTIFDVSTVTFHIGDRKGYSLLSTHEKINKVFLFTDNGELTDTIENEALRAFFNLTPTVGAMTYNGSGSEGGGNEDNDDEVDDPGENPGGDNPGGPAFPSSFSYGPYVKTEWGQGSPYNSHVEACSCDNCTDENENQKGKKKAGCVAIATAQFIIYFEKFESVTYMLKDIDFASFKAFSYLRTPETDNLIGYFVREVALGCQTKFDCKNSKSTPKAAYQYLKDIGYDVSYHEGKLNNAKAKESLSRGWPVIMGGTKGIFETGGHTWILDGMRYSALTDKTQYHCNWGWYGQSDLWLDSYYVGQIEDLQGNIVETRNYCYNKSQIFLNSL